ncbi:MAG: GDSL-type esterase/lipase family protein [Treponema sp.]|nr:GDSL-type esterase/lipase family protein [Treponema sp.]
MYDSEKVKTNQFCVTWASSQYVDGNNPPSISLENNSLRQIVKTSIATSKIRVKFSNLFGESPMELKEVHIAFSKGSGSGAIQTESDKCLLFNGNKSVEIKENSEIYSDILDFPMPERTEVSISICFGKVPEKITGHSGSRTNSFFEQGNKVLAEQFSHEKKAAHWFVLAGIETTVAENQNAKAIVCLGDSITDGRGTTDDLQNRWTDILANRLVAHNKNNLAVINEGIGGTCLTYSGVERFSRDVLSQPGIAYLILFYGINDILYANKSSQTIIEVYKNMIQKAREQNIIVYGGTILPAGKCKDMTEEKEKIRQEVNQWILSTPAEEGGFNGVIDFASIMGDSQNPLWLNTNWNFENDGLHPNADGYFAMGNFIDLSLF